MATKFGMVSNLPLCSVTSGSCTVTTTVKQEESSKTTCLLLRTAATPSPNKPAKRLGTTASEILRCKRRIDLNRLGYSLPKPQPQAVARRNERERNRVKLVNLGFATLREHVPNGSKNKKMSKVETLRAAVDYIKNLQQLLDEHDAVNAAFQNGGINAAISRQTISIQTIPSPQSYSSDSSTCSGSPLSPDEEELLDFTSWFQ